MAAKGEQDQLVAPTIENVERIKNIPDPVMRNLQITLCYYELSAVLASQLGPEANWCTFATWASKQAGQTIRKQDLERSLQRWLTQSQSALQASENVAAAAGVQGGSLAPEMQDGSLSARNFTSAIDLASDAVGRGNKKVFEEIGYEFARFYQTCFVDQLFDPQKITPFCEQLRPGDPPDGQGHLRKAFSNYGLALVEPNQKTRSELILLANLEIGFHEQTRLQPEIAESLDAGLISFLGVARFLFGGIFPANGLFHLVHLYFRRLLGRPTPLDLAIQGLLAEMRTQLRRVITETMMTISLPSGVLLRLSKDLPVGFPESLQHIAGQELRSLLEKYVLSPDSLADSGALDWADLPDRFAFIIGLFRCYQDRPALFEPPFSPEQVEALKRGSLPEGRL